MLLSVKVLLACSVLAGCYIFFLICGGILYWRKRLLYIRKLPGRKYHPTLGVLGEIEDSGETALTFLRNMVKSYPRLAYWFYGPFNIAITVAHPETVKIILKTAEPKPIVVGVYRLLTPWLGDGLLTSAGQKWARHRRLLTPAFHFDILKPYNDVNNRAVESLMEKLDRCAKNNSSFEAVNAISLCALEVVLKCAFSFKDDIQAEGDTHPYAKAINEIGELIAYRAIRPWFYTTLTFYATKKGRQFRNDVNYVHKVANEVIQRRKNRLKTEPLDKNKRMMDFLDILLTARDEDGKGLTDREIRDEVDTFLFEGHDTTASAMSWMLHSMATNPEWQFRCQQEIDEILDGRDSDDIRWEDFSKMPILTACLKENMRLNTTVSIIERETTKDIYMDGYYIPAGTVININLYGLMHNESVWEDPLTFKAERFLEEDPDRDAYAFLPFSAGPRNCIGQHFAMHEMKTIISRLLRRYTFEPDPMRPTKRMLTVVMKADGGMHLRAIPRRGLSTQG